MDLDICRQLLCKIFFLFFMLANDYFFFGNLISYQLLTLVTLNKVLLSSVKKPYAVNIGF